MVLEHIICNVYKFIHEHVVPAAVVPASGTAAAPVRILVFHIFANCRGFTQYVNKYIYFLSEMLASYVYGTHIHLYT
jgi:hypothetical protein